jgi:hypothetical protein
MDALLGTSFLSSLRIIGAIFARKRAESTDPNDNLIPAKMA